MEYLVTAHPPTTVSHSLRGRLTSISHDTLVVVRSSSITLLDLLPGGPVDACKPIELWGRVIGAELWTPAASSAATPRADDIDVDADLPRPTTNSATASLSYLLILLDAPPRPLLLVTQFDATTRTLTVAERIELPRPVGARENEFWQGLVVDERSGTVAVGVWTGTLSIVQLAEVEVEGAAAAGGTGRPKRGKAGQQGLVKTKFDVQLRDLNLLSLVFLPSAAIDPPPNPTLAFLTLTSTRVPYLRTRELDLAAKDFLPQSDETDLFALHVADLSAGLLVPVLPPASSFGLPGALLVVGDKTVSVYEATPRSIGTPGKGKARVLDAAPHDLPGSGGKRRRSSAASTGSSNAVGKFPRRESGGESASGGLARAGGRSSSIVQGSMPFSEITAWEVVDSDDTGARVLLGDSYGQLKLVLLKRDRSGRFESVETVVLGITSPVKSLTYLTSAHIFVGSHFSDSQVLQILLSPIPYKGTYLAPPSSTYANLAPVLDFCVSARGEGEIVTCSGGMGGGSLRVVREGAGWEEDVVLEGVEGVERLWSVPSPSTGGSLLFASTISGTHILSLLPEDDPMGEASPTPAISVLASSLLPHLDRGQPSLCVESVGSTAVQVTSEGVRATDLLGDRTSEWRPEGKEIVGVAAVGAEGVLLGLNNGRLVYLRLLNGSLEVAGSRQLNSEVCAITIFSPSRAVIALWDLSIVALDLSSSSLPSLSTFPAAPTLVRSLLALHSTKPDQPSALLAGLGDGSVLVSPLSEDGTATLDASSRVFKLGTNEVSLTSLQEGRAFAACDKPAVLVLEDRGRVGYQFASVKDVAAAAALHDGAQDGSLLLATPDSLVLGRLNDTKKAQIQTIPFGSESPYRIAFHPELKAYGVAFVRSEIDRFREEEVISSSFKLLDDDFQPSFTFDLELGERATALELVRLRSKLGGDAVSVFLLGTAVVDPQLSEVQKGRILAFCQGNDGKLRLLSSSNVAGMVYAISQFGPDGFAATVNSRVVLYTLDPVLHIVGSDPQLVRISQWASAYLPASLAPVGDSQLLVGDAMSSMALVETNRDGVLQTVAKDLKPLWLTSVGAVSDRTFIGSDVGSNLSTFRLVDSQLEAGGAVHHGEIINKFRKGSLRPHEQTADARAVPNLVFAATSGRLSVLATLLGPETSAVLFDLQRNMARVVRGFGGVDHADWRAYRGETGARPSAGFIDGDFVERFLDIKDGAVLAEIMEGASQWEKISLPYAELCNLLEGLRRVH